MLDPDRRHLIAYLAAAAVLVVIAVRFIGHRNGQEPIPTVSPAAAAVPRPGTAARPRAPARPLIWVDVVGAVRAPGLYSLPPGSRVAAAVERAGGIRAGANRAGVNLAAKLADGQQVVVPTRGQAAAPASAAATPTAAGAPASARISLSNATEAQLEQLDGIGPGLAGRIIAYREAHGAFRSVDELQEVSGIGAKRFEALKGSIAP